MADAPLEALQAQLATQTYPNLAGERLKACLTDLVARRGAVDLSHLEPMETDAAMVWLEQLPGVGRKIAAGVVNASTLDRKALVLDSHHRRVLQRMGLVPQKADTARAVRMERRRLRRASSADEGDRPCLLSPRQHGVR